LFGNFLGEKMSVLTALVASKFVVAVVVAGVTVTGAGAAVAYTGNLPASLQKVAHDTINAPAPADAEATSTAVVPATATPSPTLTPPVVVPPSEAANTVDPQKEAETLSAEAPEATETPEATEAPEAPQAPEAPEVEKIKAPKASKAPDAPKVKSTETPDATDTPDAPSSDN
jgi:hypothetical protein